MDTVGRYELLEKLGQGGMGVVFRANDTLLQRVVAIKLISAPIEQNAELRERFLREARAAGQLAHKNIITIHDLGEHEGRPYLAMEFLEGEDLQRRLAREPRMSLARKIELAIEMCEALDFAHGHGVIHRDIKPANIFITTAGVVKLLDFGLARLMSSDLTDSNMMMGTQNYMAPEQVRGERADQRSDIFSTGVVLYEMLCGRKAFHGDSLASTLFKILEGVPEPLRKIDSTLPAEVVAIVERALAKSRENRYQHMSEILSDLVAYRQRAGVFDSPPGAYRPPSGAPRAMAISSRASMGPPDSWQGVAWDAPTAMSVPTPLGSPAPISPARPARRRATVMMGGTAAILVAVAGLWMAMHRSGPPVVPDVSRLAAATAAADRVAIAAALQQATQAFESEDYAGAERSANAVLARAPDHGDARRIRDRARSSADTVERGVREARTLYDAGRYEEASRTAGDVLSVAPKNAAAARIMADGAARSRGLGAEQARTRMGQSKAAARTAGAPTLATGPYGAASAAEREADRLDTAGRRADATTKFYEASGLFRSAEIAAQSKPAAVAVSPPVTPAPVDPKPAQPDPLPAPLPSAAPAAPALALVPALPVTPAPVGVPPPVSAESPSSAGATEDSIADLLVRYKAALEARSFDALKRLWPTVRGAQQTAIQNEFDHARRIDVEIIGPQISMSGGAATVSFLRRYDVQTIDGQQLRTRTHTTMTLRRAGSTWVVEQIRFDPAR